MPSGAIISIHKFKIEQNNTHCSYMSFVASVITLVLNINNNINANNNNNNQVLYLVFCIIIDYKKMHFDDHPISGEYQFWEQQQFGFQLESKCWQ